MEVSRMLATPIEGSWAASPATPTKTPPRFEIDIHSDVVCPFCYIGKKYLDRAIALYQEQNPDAEFIVRWRPVILYPHARRSGSKRKHYIDKLGATASVFFDRVEGMAADLGMKIEWEGRLGSSWDSHKLILLAMEQDEAAAAAAQAQQQQQQSNESDVATSVVPYARTDETVMALFRGIFEESRNPADRHFLVEVALRVGLVEDGTQLLAWLDEPELRARVEAETAHAKAQRISAVPTFVVQGRYRVGGMQEPGVFLMLFDKIRANEHGLGRPIPDVTGDFMEAKICSGEQAYSREREREERERKI